MEIPKLKLHFLLCLPLLRTHLSPEVVMLLLLLLGFPLVAPQPQPQPNVKTGSDVSPAGETSRPVGLDSSPTPPFFLALLTICRSLGFCPDTSQPRRSLARPADSVPAGPNMVHPMVKRSMQILPWEMKILPSGKKLYETLCGKWSNKPQGGMKTGHAMEKCRKQKRQKNRG